MDRRQLIRSLAGGLAVTLAPGLAACTYRGYYPTQGPRIYPPYYYDYYYYPHVGVYFHPYSGDYHYYSQGNWRRTRALPRHIYLDPWYRRKVIIRDKRPYDRYREHQRIYPSPPVQHRDRVQDRDRARDRQEREHNTKQYQKYQRGPKRK